MADKALLVGINEYEFIGRLNGCLNDVDNLRSLLISDFGFDDSNIDLLLEEEAVYHNIQDGLMNMIDQAEEGDRLVFHFSGHGSFIDSEDDDEMVDELLCLYNMEWDNPDSYLVDDDLGALLEDLKPGVHMTVILDACHSGTGTKAITPGGRSVNNPTSKSPLVIINDAQQTMAGGLMRSLSAKSGPAGVQLLARDANPPLARFVTPPPHVLQKMAAAKLNRVGEHLAEDEYNHQLLAGADALQTAADAYIDNQYQGAFTYHLCDSSRELGGGVSVASVFENAKSNLRSAGYHQTPQLEGIGQNERLFGGKATEVVDLGQDSGAATGASIPNVPVAKFDVPSGASHSEILAGLIRVQEKFLDLGSQFLGGVSASDTRVDVVPASRGAERIVYVHGISQHRRGYSDNWYSSLRPYLTTALPKSEVLWSDLVNPRNVPRQKATRETSDLKQAIEAELAKRKQAIEDQVPAGHKVAGNRRDGFMIDDFVRYMTIESTRNQIIERFNAVVKPLLENGQTLHIIAHSWGTVVAYEGLRLMDQQALNGRVENLFTVGAALSISAVQWNLFNRVSDGRLPVHVNRVVNMDAGGDIVGGVISDAFTCHHERVNLVPTGCMRIPFTNKAISVSCAHSSYFDSGNAVTNRDLFGRWINA